LVLEVEKVRLREVLAEREREREREAAFWFDGCGFKHKPFLLALLIVGVPFNITILFFVLSFNHEN
jgi:hypothetical protein